MSKQVSALIITGYGTSCETECAYALRESGADSIKLAHFSELQDGTVILTDYNFLILPGGLADGDDLGAAQAAAQRWKHAKTINTPSPLAQLDNFIKQGGIVLGIAGGFQLLLKLGLLPAIGGKYFERQCAAATNSSASFEDRWCTLQVKHNSPCIFTKGLKQLYLPVRQAEGKIVTSNAQLMEQLETENQVAIYYTLPNSTEPTTEYPANPCGSPHGIAGLCDPSGHIFGLIPHPEAYNHATNHPGWKRGETSTSGLEIFKNGVKFLREQ